MLTFLFSVGSGYITAAKFDRRNDGEKIFDAQKCLLYIFTLSSSYTRIYWRSLTKCFNLEM